MKNKLLLFSTMFCLLAIGGCQNEHCPATVTDIDGNIYNTVKIGNQCWMKENLKTTHYRDGSGIREVEDNATWANISDTIPDIPAWCYSESNAGHNATYGKLYNWYAVTDPRNICPVGWHVPTDGEFTQLTDYLGGEAVAGGKMKAITHWNSPNTGADNSSGFTALPAVSRYSYGSFSFIGSFGSFWSSTESDSSGSVWYRDVYSNDSHCYRNDGVKGNGFSVRCVRD